MDRSYSVHKTKSVCYLASKGVHAHYPALYTTLFNEWSSQFLLRFSLKTPTSINVILLVQLSRVCSTVVGSPFDKM